MITRIKDELEKENISVWMSDDFNLDSMRKGVENCDIFISCVTEKYRQSIRCRAESEYAFNLDKSTIHLTMQKGYDKIDGWIGSLYDDSLVVLTKNEFEDCVKRLANEIRAVKNRYSKRNSLTPSMKSDAQASIREESYTPNKKLTSEINASLNGNCKDYASKNWGETETNKWFVDSDIEQAILESLKPINGENLYQLFQIQMHIPEFFYKSIIKDEAVTLKAVMHFSTCLKKLYEK